MLNVHRISTFRAMVHTQVKGTKQLKLDPLIYDALQKEKVLPGDVIYIEANSGMHCQLSRGLVNHSFNASHCIVLPGDGSHIEAKSTAPLMLLSVSFRPNYYLGLSGNVISIEANRSTHPKRATHPIVPAHACRAGLDLRELHLLVGCKLFGESCPGCPPTVWGKEHQTCLGCAGAVKWVGLCIAYAIKQ